MAETVREKYTEHNKRDTVDISICNHLSVECGTAAVVQWEMAFNFSF